MAVVLRIRSEVILIAWEIPQTEERGGLQFMGLQLDTTWGLNCIQPHISDLHLMISRLLMYMVKWKWRQATR